jgi:Uma2 family endonuclease
MTALKERIGSKIGVEKNGTKPSSTIPNALIWEVIDGKPLYRRGYKSVLGKQKTTDDIMGTSSSQALLTAYLNRLLVKNLDEELYDIWTGEPGLHLEKNDNFSNDIVVHEIVSAARISTQYANYPPKLVVEIDIEIDPDSMPDTDYLQKKTSKMLDFGVERVVWILSYVKKVIVADRLKNTWVMHDWDTDIELMHGIMFNIQRFLEKRGINPDSMTK